MEKEMLYKSRSFSSCILAAYKLMSKNLWTILKATWLPVLLYAILLALFLVINLPNEEVVAQGVAHFALFIGLLVGCVIGLIVAGIWALSRLMSVINEESRRWNFMRVVWLTLNSLVITVVIAAIIVGLVKIGGDRLTLFADSHFWWFLIATFIVLLAACILFLPLNYVFMKYLNDKGMHFWRDFLPSYRLGLRRVGFIFITLFITGLIVTILASIVVIPYLTLTSAYYTSLMGYLMGDPSDLPHYFFILFFLTAVAVFFLLWYVEAFMIIVVFFMYTSIEKRREEQHTVRMEEQEVPSLPTEESEIPPISLQP